MIDVSELPWALGAAELLEHGIELLQRDTEAHRRLAIIAIDNAVEIMIKSYIGLPFRINKLRITRKDVEAASESFPALLNALEQDAPEKLEGVELGIIEYYHRQRNELYHRANVLTIRRDQVEAYAVLANQLFHNLFGIALVRSVTKNADVLGQFVEAWTIIERAISAAAKRDWMRAPPSATFREAPRTLKRAVAFLAETHALSAMEAGEIERFRLLRNEVLHTRVNYRTVLTVGTMMRIEELANRLRSMAERGEPFESDEE